MEMPRRKDLRLQGYDYSLSGCYFVTVCVQEHKNIFWEFVGANCVRPSAIPLSAQGRIVKLELEQWNRTYSNVSIEKWVIMPDHIHLLVRIHEDNGRTQFAPTLSRMVKQFKGSVTKRIGCSIWQKSYYDHIIRDDLDYEEKWNYIENNPNKYYLVKEKKW